MAQKYKKIQAVQNGKIEGAVRCIDELQKIMVECQIPGSELGNLMKRYKEVQTSLVNLCHEMEQSKNNIQVQSGSKSLADEEKLQKIQHEVLSSTEIDLQKIDVEEEKAVSQLKRVYLAMRLPEQSEEDEASSLEP